MFVYQFVWADFSGLFLWYGCVPFFSSAAYKVLLVLDLLVDLFQVTLNIFLILAVDLLVDLF